MSSRMPVTRTSDRQFHKNAQAKLPHEDRDFGMTISFSPEPVAVVNKRKRNSPQRSKSIIPIGEVIEISSDDEPAPPPNPAIADLRRQIKKLREENSKCQADLIKSRAELVHAQAEILELEALPKPGKNQLVLDASRLEENVNCEICTARLWSPYILPDCGHTFCLSCLQDWFGTTLAQFMTTHPHYNANAPAPHHQAFLHNNHPLAAVYMAQMQQQMAKPQYTCPTCREVVRNRPVEEFALKALVRTVAAAAGESSPQKQISDIGRGKTRMPASRPSGPWDGFFPRSAV